MKFRQAHFTNFRLLRDVELTFSRDPNRPLTVIRAENDSGKTTALVGLLWVLFGDDALPGGGKDYRLHPIDWDAAAAAQVPIEVELEFEDTRSTTERLSGNVSSRGDSAVTLFKITPEGSKAIDNPRLLLGEMLPKDLREVFFTDGDRALSFIEADVEVASKRRRVEAAIKALLGLNILEDAQGHVKNAGSEINKRIRRTDAGSTLGTISERLETVQASLGSELSQLQDATQQLATVETYLFDVEKAIDAALRKGDQEQLAKEREGIRTEVASLEKQEKDLKRKHSDLFKSSALAIGFLRTALGKAGSVLDGMKDRGAIPSNAIPVLKERLEVKVCICGTSLGEGTHERQCVLDLIEQQRHADEIRDRLTELYYRARSYRQQEDDSEHDWRALYRDVAGRRNSATERLSTLRGKAQELDLRIAELGDTDVASLRKHKAGLYDQRDRQTRAQAQAQTHIAQLKTEEADLARQQEQLLRSKSQYLLMRSELEAAQDVLSILERTHETIVSEELREVSQTMNSLFLRMIGADPEQGALIRRAEITDEFDIVVYGPANKTLDPDRDLNGASRRALTLGFILALGRVSGVEAPNVIDTPLGMMDPQVKRLVLENATEASAQLALFLTRSEINDIEDLLDGLAGVAFTLTNSAHYPTRLKNDPKTEGARTLRCECSYRQVCALCERVQDDGDGLAYRRPESEA